MAVSLNTYLRNKYGKKLYKVSINAGFTCPNRDGTLDTRGCIFCSGSGSGDFAERPDLSVSEQIELGKERIKAKLPKDGYGYIAYFQAFTNTYDSPERLRKMYMEAADHPEVEIISIATRPDCLGDDVLEVISDINKFKPVWVELGLQTIHSASADYIRRGYPLEVYDEAVRKLKERHIETIVHVILGLPGESKEDMLDTVRYVGKSGVQGIKLQLLHVLEGTDLAKDYRAGKFECMTLDEYAGLVKECLDVLPEDIVIHRMTGDGAKKILIAPKWSADKKKVINLLGKTCRLLVAAMTVIALEGCTYVLPNYPVPQSGTVTDEAENTDKSASIKEENKGSGTVQKETITLNPEWEWADNSKINTGSAVLYKAAAGRKDIVVAVNAGHGTSGGEDVKVYCHPDRSPKITDGTNPKGSLKAVAISIGMLFYDGTPESDVTLAASRILKDKLLDRGYDVLMLRDEEDVRLDNVARSVIANNIADCHVALHWDGDGLDHDKGCFYVPVPDEIKEMDPVNDNWREHERLGKALIDGLAGRDCLIYEGLVYPQELTQTCYSTIPSAVVELGNGASKHDDKTLDRLTDGLLDGVMSFMDNDG